jgi:hypothetical protein
VVLVVGAELLLVFQVPMLAEQELQAKEIMEALLVQPAGNKDVVVAVEELEELEEMVLAKLVELVVLG